MDKSFFPEIDYNAFIAASKAEDKARFLEFDTHLASCDSCQKGYTFWCLAGARLFRICQNRPYNKVHMIDYVIKDENENADDRH